jgi:hypothetical protein
MFEAENLQRIAQIGLQEAQIELAGTINPNAESSMPPALKTPLNRWRRLKKLERVGWLTHQKQSTLDGLQGFFERTLGDEASTILSAFEPQAPQLLPVLVVSHMQRIQDPIQGRSL